MRVEARDVGRGLAGGTVVLLASAMISSLATERLFAYPLTQAGLSLGVASVVALSRPRKEPPVDRFAPFWAGKETLISRYQILNGKDRLSLPEGDWHRRVLPWLRRFHELCVEGDLVPAIYLDQISRDRYLSWLFHKCDLDSYKWEQGSSRRGLWFTLIDWARCGCREKLNLKQRQAVLIASLDYHLGDFERTLDEECGWFSVVPVESFAKMVVALKIASWERLMGLVSYANQEQRRRFLSELGTLLDAHWDEVGCRNLVIRRYAYAVADFDLPLSYERFIEVVNGVDDKRWIACGDGLRKRLKSAKTYHEAKNFPPQAEKVIKKMWKGNVPSLEEIRKIDCPRLLK